MCVCESSSSLLYFKILFFLKRMMRNGKPKGKKKLYIHPKLRLYLRLGVDPSLLFLRLLLSLHLILLLQNTHTNRPQSCTSSAELFAAMYIKFALFRQLLLLPLLYYCHHCSWVCVCVCMYMFLYEHMLRVALTVPFHVHQTIRNKVI